jgi:pimeloyl-ACP methyl ester carboxylesterase
MSLGAGFEHWGCAQLSSYTASYLQWGEGRPLVLVPGLAGGMELVAPLARILAERYRVISYQLRGEEDCFALRRRFGLTDLVDDLEEMLDWFCLERPILVGVSFGGVIALELAARYPHRFDAVAVQGVGVRLEKGLVQRVASSVLADYPLPSDSAFVNQFFNLLYGCRPEPGPLFDFVTQQSWQTDQSVMAHRFRLAEQYDLEGKLSRIQTPTLVMIGGRDMLVSASSLRSLTEEIPDARLTRFPECGHLAFVTHPARVAQELNQFLDKIQDN